MSERLKILLVEDSEPDAELLRYELRHAAIEHESRRVDTQADFERGRKAFRRHVITAPDGAFESWSETLPQLIGAQRDQIPASTREWLDLLHPDDRAAFRAGSIEARTRHERKDVDYRLRHNGGAWIHVRQTMEPLGAGTQSAGESRWFNTLQDVTQQVRAESDLRRSEAKFRTLIGQAADGIFLTDSRGQFLLANSRYCEMLGYSEEELLRMNVADTFPEAERAQARQRIPQLREVKNRLYERRMH